MTSVYEQINNESGDIKHTVIVSIAEIYNENVKDLLDTNKIDLKIVKNKSKGTHIQDITEYLCSDEFEVFQLIDLANKNKAVASNRINQKSSRSHTIMTLKIVMTN